MSKIFCLEQIAWKLSSNLRERRHSKIRIRKNRLHQSSQPGSSGLGEGHVPRGSRKSNHESAKQHPRRRHQKSSVHHLQCN